MLPEPIHSIIIGSLLGDACLELNGRYYRIRFDHSWKEKEYIWWKYKLLYPIAALSPKLIKVLDNRTQKMYLHFRFDSKSIPELAIYAKWFYINNKKRVPLIIDKLLYNPLALAVWYMDDGHRRTDCKALRLNTQGFLSKDIDRLIEVLYLNFGLEVRKHYVRKGQWVIYFPRKTAQCFCDLIRCHVLPKMGYKLL